MKHYLRTAFVPAFVFLFFFMTVWVPSPAPAAKKDKKVEALSAEDKYGKVNAAFDADQMGDMSDFDPSNPVTPTGDTIKIAVVTPFSGPATASGEFSYLIVQWVAHDINKRGGIWVDGKKKLVQVIKADNMSKQDQCKKICEKMVLQEKVHILWGTNGSNLMKVINEVANKYKVIAVNCAALSDELMDATNFNRYFFHARHGHQSNRPWHRLLLWSDPEEREKILHPLPGLHVWSRHGGWIQAGFERILPRSSDRR